MKYDYDLICIGLGPAGMAVSAMTSEMGLKVCAVEKHKIGGECMNVGCIPSKSLLRMARTRHLFDNLETMELASAPKPEVKRPFARIHDYVEYINRKKTRPMFDKVDLVLGEGPASFVDPHTVGVGGRRISARRVFIAAGTSPMVPPIPGIEDVEYLTNENIFDLNEVPRSMVIIGGGAIGCEMAQAFSRLGSRCTIVHMDEYLIPVGERDAGEILEEAFRAEGIEVYNGRRLVSAESTPNGVNLVTDRGEKLEGEKLLVAAGRKMDLSSLNLDAAGVKTTTRGAIRVNRYLQTSRRHIYAVGDCNGHYLLTHAAMHQGMIAVMNSMMPPGMKRDFRKYVVPWTVFTDPEVSHVGPHAAELDRRGVKYETIELKYGDYGGAVAQDAGTGFLKVYAGPTGRIYGARIVGEGSGEMINEWALAVQKGIRMHDIMMLQHSFPTMGFLTKRAGDTWMMNRMKAGWLKRMMQWMFRR
jgi:pyruvate/2-oxoglutarate dehydrogenase complex dihydrolipoamide dehydrogenase (E3) component